MPARNAAATLGACLTSISDASAATGPSRADRRRQRLDGCQRPRSPPPPARPSLSLPGLRVSAVRNRAARQSRAHRCWRSSMPIMYWAASGSRPCASLFAEPSDCRRRSPVLRAARRCDVGAARLRPPASHSTGTQATSPGCRAATWRSEPTCFSGSADSTKPSRHAKTSTCAGGS